MVVQAERPDLGERQMQLINEQNEFTIKLQALADGLLQMLAEAEGDLTENEELIISLEEAKATSIEITEKVAVAKETEKTIAKAREIYRPMGERGALMFFLINQMFVISHMYAERKRKRSPTPFLTLTLFERLEPESMPRVKVASC